MPGELAGHLFDSLAAKGALEVSAAPVSMKKSRPGLRLAVIAPPGSEHGLAEALLRETTTFGVRMRTETRLALARRTVAARTPWGEVRVKLGLLGDEIVQASPEYEDCRGLAESEGIPLKRIYEAALRALDR
jgi:hypothetical protein